MIKKTKRGISRAQKRTTKKKYCSPIVEGSTPMPYTCYTAELLLELKNKWNQRHADVKIETNDPKQIWNFLNENLKNVCDEEKCWLKQGFIDNETKSKIENLAFPPETPIEWHKDPNTWLSSVDITQVMNQYEHKYKCFKFIGPSPIDFDSNYKNTKNCVWEELCHFSLQKYLDKKVHKIGIIFNLDKHTESGSHWVSLFINTRKGIIFYFDSTGVKIPPEIEALKDRIIKQGAEADEKIDFEFHQNTKKHQKEDTECGMYSLFFIISMLKDARSIEFFKRSEIPDKKMENFRKVYFS